MTALETCLASRMKSLRGGVCVAFSGGADSSLLAHAASRFCSERPAAVLLASELIPDSDVAWARRVAGVKGLHLFELRWDPLGIEEIRRNGPDRCYWCKLHMYKLLQGFLLDSGLGHIADGTNADDLREDRPGLKAVEELGVKTPLADCGMEKAQVRRLGRRYGIPSWDRPSQSCLATRVARGFELTREVLRRVEAAEGCLRDMGIGGKLRVRCKGDVAHIQVEEASGALVKGAWKEIKDRLSGLGFSRLELATNYGALCPRATKTRGFCLPSRRNEDIQNQIQEREGSYE